MMTGVCKVSFFPSLISIQEREGDDKELRCASYCFPIEKAGRQDFKHMIALPSINRDIENLEKKKRGAHGIYTPV